MKWHQTGQYALESEAGGMKLTRLHDGAARVLQGDEEIWLLLDYRDKVETQAKEARDAPFNAWAERYFEAPAQPKEIHAATPVADGTFCDNQSAGREGRLVEERSRRSVPAVV